MRLFTRTYLHGEWRSILQGPGYRPTLLFRPHLPPRPAPDAPRALPPVRLHTRMTRMAAAGAIIHSFLWLAGVFIVLSFRIPSSLSSACCCCCILSIVAGSLLLSAHDMALPVMCISHSACVALCFSMRSHAVAAALNGHLSRIASEFFLCAHACALCLLLLVGRQVVKGVQPQLAAAAV